MPLNKETKPNLQIMIHEYLNYVKINIFLKDKVIKIFKKSSQKFFMIYCQSRWLLPKGLFNNPHEVKGLCEICLILTYI